MGHTEIASVQEFILDQLKAGKLRTADELAGAARAAGVPFSPSDITWGVLHLLGAKQIEVTADFQVRLASIAA